MLRVLVRLDHCIGTVHGSRKLITTELERGGGLICLRCQLGLWIIPQDDPKIKNPLLTTINDTSLLPELRHHS
jgi:hypothetical protein